MTATMKDSINSENRELFDLAGEAAGVYSSLLRRFNGKQMKLGGAPPHQRILLFFLTRAIKTYNSILILCREGYGQDAAPLLRSVLEALISVKYVLCRPQEADQKAVRFVEYKWVILKRYLSEIERDPDHHGGDEDIRANRDAILSQFAKFKEKYRIISDRALITWSGKATKDMASAADKRLVEEYELAFRADSRFSHPSIFGDKEYLDFNTGAMVFSFAPSGSGIVHALKRAISYLSDFLDLFDSVFDLSSAADIRKFREHAAETFRQEKYQKALHFEKSLPPLNKDEAGKLSVQFSLPE